MAAAAVAEQMLLRSTMWTRRVPVVQPLVRARERAREWAMGKAMPLTTIDGVCTQVRCSQSAILQAAGSRAR